MTNVDHNGAGIALSCHTSQTQSIAYNFLQFGGTIISCCNKKSIITRYSLQTWKWNVGCTLLVNIWRAASCLMYWKRNARNSIGCQQSKISYRYITCTMIDFSFELFIGQATVLKSNISLNCCATVIFSIGLTDWWSVLQHKHWWHDIIYRQVSNIRRTKSQHLKDSHSVLQLSLLNPLKPDVKSRMKM